MAAWASATRRISPLAPPPHLENAFTSAAPSAAFSLLEVFASLPFQQKSRSTERLFCLAGAVGIEPTTLLLERSMMPLHQAPMILAPNARYKEKSFLASRTSP